MENDKEHPRVLIEEWFPFKEVSIECQRERIGKFIPLNRFHIWWARRPLIVSRAAIIGSILPSESKESFKKFVQIDHDIRKKAKIWESLKKQGKTPTGISTKKAYENKLNQEELLSFHTILNQFWNTERLKFLDPMSGGGAIPFEAYKLGLDTYSSDLNPIPIILQYITIPFATKYKEKIIDLVRKYTNKVLERLNDTIKYFPINTELEYDGFIWVRTIQCFNPECQIEIPLAKNWLLLNKSNKPKIILKLLLPKDGGKICNFKIITGPNQETIRNNKYTVKNGIINCPKCNHTISKENLYQFLKESSLGHRLVAIAYKEKDGKRTRKNFRLANDIDQKAIKEIDSIIEEKKEEWALKNLLINDQIQKGEKTNELLRKGINKWYDLFNNRQLFANTSLLESISEIKKEILKKIVDLDLAKAVISMLQIGFDRCVDYNSVITLWDSTRLKVGHTFVGHDFGFKWRYGEIDLIRKGYRWFIEDLLKVFNEIIDLTNEKTSNININLMNAMNLENLKDNSIDLIVVDPPYYNNVIYSELSDYFYVWMKRNLSDLYPDVFRAELADKDNEAVANTSRFEGLGKNKKKLASEDYESKMEKIFYELNRVLKIHGVMTIMFTHKATDAWDTLTMAIMKAGFEITASWPVATESPISANIKDKNAVKTTILLVCRKRLGENKEVWWEDEVLPSLKKIADKKGKEFKRMGIDGVDLFIAAFGPTLQEFSKNYPVKNIEGEELRAEEALKITREVISSIIFNDIMKDTNLRLDLHSKFYILAWKIYGARKFPFDEARNLALSLGINIDELKGEGIIKKTSGDIQLISPKDREKNGSININNPKDNGFLINAVHIAILAYEEGGKELYENVIEKLRRNTDKTFRLYMETLFNIMPDVKDLAKNLPEKKILGEILMTTEEKITPKGGKITDFLDK